MLQHSVSGAIELGDDVVFKAGHLVPLRYESKNLPNLVDAWQRGDLGGGGPRVTCDPSSVEVVFNGRVHDDVNVCVLGEHDDGLSRGCVDVAQQLGELRAGLPAVLGEVAGQDVNKFNADVSHFTQELNDVIAAVLPVLIITSYYGHCPPVEQLHQPSDGLCLMLVTGYCSQKSGELQLPAELFTS